MKTGLAKSSGKRLLLGGNKYHMQDLLEQIVGRDSLHARWLNTLSFMENAGARKISACEHPTLVDFIQLKHAAEEHRHAYYLKKQIAKIDPESCKTFQLHELLAPQQTRHYLHQLDMQTCRYLKTAFGLEGRQLKYRKATHTGAGTKGTLGDGYQQ